MKIWQTPPNAPIARKRRLEGGTQVFSVGGDGGATAGAAAAGPMQPLTAPGSILTVQEIEGDFPGDGEKARRRGEALLDSLASLQVEMIDGFVSEAALRRIADLVDEAGPETSDDPLRHLLGDIELRAAVELAKIEKHRG